LQSIIFGYDNETPPLSLCACALVAGAMTPSLIVCLCSCCWSNEGRGVFVWVDFKNQRYFSEIA